MIYQVVATMDVKADNPEEARQKVINLITKSKTAKANGITLLTTIYKSIAIDKLVMKIPAEVHTDNYLYEVHFDAVEWFEKASVEEIIDLALVEWGGDEPADRVAYFFGSQADRPGDQLDGLFTYLTEMNGCQYDPMGFECYVNEEKALAWLKENRPNVIKVLIKQGLLDPEELPDTFQREE